MLIFSEKHEELKWLGYNKKLLKILTPPITLIYFDVANMFMTIKYSIP